MSVRIYVLCYSQTVLSAAIKRYNPYPWAFPILLKYQDNTFENAFWRQLDELKDEWIDCDMVGAISHLAFTKIKIDEIDAMIAEKTSTCDYLHFLVDNSGKYYVDHHPNLKTIMDDVMRTLNLTKSVNSFCNYRMCKPALMIKFIEWFTTVLKPAVLAHPLIMTDAHYNGKMKTAALTALCGLPYYPHLPFVLERLTDCFFTPTDCFFTPTCV